MTDPLGSGVLSGAVDDVQSLTTTSYLPVYVGALVAATAIGVGLAWLRRGMNRFRKT